MEEPTCHKDEEFEVEESGGNDVDSVNGDEHWFGGLNVSTEGGYSAEENVNDVLGMNPEDEESGTVENSVRNEGGDSRVKEAYYSKLCGLTWWETSNSEEERYNLDQLLLSFSATEENLNEKELAAQRDLQEKIVLNLMSDYDKFNTGENPFNMIKIYVISS